MKIIFARRHLTLGIIIFSLLMNGCSGENQIPNTASVSPTTLPSATSTPPPTVSTPKKAPTSTMLALQTNIVSASDNASFVSETYPDNSVLKPGENFIKTFEIKNISSTTWTTSYALALDQASQENETLDSPMQIKFPQETPPGGKIVFQLSLVAPVTPGTYIVYWVLKNDRGETIPVDGINNIWAKILVCDPKQPCNPPVAGGGAVSNGVSVTLIKFTSGAQSTVASFCMTLPNRNYGPTPGTVSLLLDQQTILASTGGSLEAGCFEFEFPVVATQIQQAKTVAVSISQVRIIGGPNYPDEACQAARLTLMTQYPGLDFQCHFTMAGYYSNLQAPSGMTSEQANQIIYDAIEGAINGPWVLTAQ